MLAMIFTSNLRNDRIAAMFWCWGVPLLALLSMALLLLLSANVSLFLFLNGGLSVLGDKLWSHLTVLGDSTIALMFMLPFISRRPTFVWQFVLAAVLASLLTHGIKELLSAPRPPALLQASDFHLIGQSLQNNSFPSGHTITAFTLAGLFCLQILNGTARYAMLVLAVLIGLSRIACGVHWPLDVLGGMIIGWLSALGGIWLGQRWHKAGENIWLQRALALLGSALALWVVTYYDNDFAGTKWLQFLIGAGCLAWSLPGLFGLLKVRIR
jgi:membrane-associated phospholipid phosphatase